VLHFIHKSAFRGGSGHIILTPANQLLKDEKHGNFDLKSPLPESELDRDSVSSMVASPTDEQRETVITSSENSSSISSTDDVNDDSDDENDDSDTLALISHFEKFIGTEVISIIK
jgi:hypothetical protein